MVRLVKPTVDLKQEYLDMLAEWKAEGGNLVPWVLGFEADDFRHWSHNWRTAAGASESRRAPQGLCLRGPAPGLGNCKGYGNRPCAGCM
jgi:predicted acetyltransferase